MTNILSSMPEKSNENQFYSRGLTRTTSSPALTEVYPESGEAIGRHVPYLPVLGVNGEDARPPDVKVEDDWGDQVDEEDEQGGELELVGAVQEEGAGN